MRTTFWMTVIATAAGCTQSGKNPGFSDVSSVQTVPIGLDDAGPDGFTARELLDFVGVRAYTLEAAPDTMGMDVDDSIVENVNAPVTLVLDAATAEAAILQTVEDGVVTGERLQVTAQVTTQSGDSEIDVSGTIRLSAWELTEPSVSWIVTDDYATGDIFIQTGTLPAWVQPLIEDRAAQSLCGERTGDPDVWEDGTVGVVLVGGLSSPALKIGVLWDSDATASCPVFENLDVAQLVSEAP